MNEQHLQLCGSQQWAEHLARDVVPWAMERTGSPARLLEVGPGPGAATEVLRQRAGSVTAVEHDAGLACDLAERFSHDTSVEVVEGDATDLDFADASFDAAASFTMLHHVPSPELQDRLFAEVARVLVPGGVFCGVDSLGGPALEALHVGDVCVPVDPLTLGPRLEGAGFVDVDVAVRSVGVRWIAYTPEPSGARGRVGPRFLELYDSEDFQGLVADQCVPQLLALGDLGDEPLHLVAGPASAIGPLRSAAPRLTVGQLDPELVPSVAERWRPDPAVEVIGVDPTDLPFPVDRFSAATVILSLLHLRSPATQDRTLRELGRVLRPGAPLVGLNAIDGTHFRSLNDDGRAVPIDPMTFPRRLEGAGFTDVHLDVWTFPRFLGRAPAGAC